MNKNLLRGLYAITDESLMSESDFLFKSEQALLGGAKLIQYRDKSNDTKKRLRQASALKELCEQTNALLIINDDVELTNAVKAHGVHLGKNDVSINNARQQLGENAVIGVSCYDQLNLALAAEKAGANYVAFGAFFPSSTKPQAKKVNLELINTAKQQLHIPICAIGGITVNNANALIDQGADMTAVISDLFSSDDIQTTASHIARLFS